MMRFLLLFIIISVNIILTAYAQVGELIFLDHAKSTDAASQKLWQYILDETRLSAKRAESYNIYEKDCKAVFYDLDDDGTDEIIGTHQATASRYLGDNNMYILKKQKNGKYQDIGFRVFFTQHSPIFILKNKTKGYHDLRSFNRQNNNESVFIFDTNIEKYVNKAHQKDAEYEYNQMYY